MNVKKFVWICLKRLRSRVMPQNPSEKANMLIYRLTRGQLSPLDAQRNVRGYPGIVNDIQPCPKRYLLMLLARVGARTDSTTHAATTREAWPISVHAYWHIMCSMRRGFALQCFSVASYPGLLPPPRAHAPYVLIMRRWFFGGRRPPGRFHHVMRATTLRRMTFSYSR